MKPLGRWLRLELSRPVGRFRMSLLLLLLIVVAGATGYVLLERMDWIEAVYMTVITLTTVGFGEVKPLSTVGRVFTVGLILLGVGAVAWAARNAVEVVFGESLWDEVRRRRMQEAIDSLHGHYIVCGYGRMGRQVCRDLKARTESAVVVEMDEELAEELEEAGLDHVIGNATQEEVLEKAGVAQAGGLVAALDTDADNVLAVLTARGLNSALLIVARASSEATANKLRRAGADRVVSPYAIGGHRLALSLLRPSVDDFLSRLFHFDDELGVDIGQVVIGPESPFVGQTLAECDLRREWGLTVLAVVRPTGALDMTPDGDHRIAEGEILIVIGSQDAIYELERVHEPSSL